MGFISFMVITLLSKLTPFTLAQITVIDEHSPVSLVNTALIVQGVFSLFVFLAPAGLFAYLAHPEPLPYLGLRAPGKKIQLLLVILIMLGAIPVLEMIGGLISRINFGADVKASQEANDQMQNAFLNMPDFTSFLRVFIIMAIVPALGEEMFFRGVLLRFAKKRMRSMVFPILFTALVFAAAHSNVYGLLSIFLAGILLAVIYNLTGSLWCSIVAHLVFNGSQIVLAYAGGNNATSKAMADSSAVPYYLAAAGAVVFGISFYFLLKNKTPLPTNWTDDFPPEEPTDGADGNWDFMAKS